MPAQFRNFNQTYQLCPGQSQTFGFDPDDFAGACYFEWTPHTGLDNPFTLNPLANPTISTNYELRAVDFYGNPLTPVTVEIEVRGLRAELFKPKVVAGNTTSPTTTPRTGQTWVNLDNDDNDAQFDNTDNDVVGGDDELMRLVVTGDDAGDIKINAVAGGADIKIWLNENKTGAYLSGTPIGLTQLPGGGLWQKEFWIEGVAAHNAQHGTQLEVVDDPATCAPIVVNITVLGVQSLEWVGQGNGFDSLAVPRHTSNTLDTNDPNFQRYRTNRARLDNLMSHRVFADARAPDFHSPRDSVRLEARLSTQPIEDIELYVRSFDIDDPFNDDRHDSLRTHILPAAVVNTLPLFVDPNDRGGAGLYSGTDSLIQDSTTMVRGIRYTAHEDNRGSVGGLKSGRFSGQDANQVATITFAGNAPPSAHSIFHTSHHPGDNYRAAASGDADFLRRLRNKDMSDSLEVVDSLAGRITMPHVSHVLTVWRILHVEAEYMANFSYINPFVQQLYGYINDFQSPINSSDAVLLFSTKLPIPSMNLTGIRNTSHQNHDPSLNIDDNIYEYGRFENGKLYLGLNGINTTTGSRIFGVKGNGDSTIHFHAPINISGITAYLRPIGSSIDYGATLNIVKRRNAGNSFAWVFNGLSNATIASAIGGKLAIGDNQTTNSRWIMTVSSVSGDTIFTDSLRMPFIIRDDDTDPSMNLISQNLGFSITSHAFSRAYIIVENDGGGSLNHTANRLPFIENSIGTTSLLNTLQLAQNSVSNESTSFWVVYVSSAWQGGYLDDYDSNVENLFLGGTFNHFTPSGFVSNTAVTKGGTSSLIYSEVGYDFGGTDVENTIAHEVGHQFGLDHGEDKIINGNLIYSRIPEYPHIGLMSSTDGNSLFNINILITRHVNLIRCREMSPGH